jgi:hypothetical protein
MIASNRSSDDNRKWVAACGEPVEPRGQVLRPAARFLRIGQSLSYDSAMQNTNVYGPSETIGQWDYFLDQNGHLYRAERWLPSEARPAEFVVHKLGSAFALRLARLAAGLPEHGTQVQ